MKKIFVLINFLFFISLLNGENLNISQIDSSSLLLNQNIDLYLQITDEKGDSISGVTKNNFKVSESSNHLEYSSELEILDLKEGINRINGINFLLLVDNSGSMYRAISGEETEDLSEMRISIAKEAIKNFVKESIDVKDSISLASFNSFYTFHARDIREEGFSILDTINKPDEKSNKTELYLSLVDSLKAFSKIRGRKVVIVLSDGANVPHNKSFVYSYEDTIDEFLKEGVSIYGINFAGEADKNLIKITSKTGGNIFEASDIDELYSVYDSIKEQILKEYLLTYRATMKPGTVRDVKLIYNDSNELIRSYFSSSVFGESNNHITPLLYIIPILALGLLIAIWFIKFEKLNSTANIEVLQAAPGVTISDQTLELNRGKTVIGGSSGADLTISSDLNSQDDLATIVYDEKTENFKVVSSKTVVVNNQLTNERVLESGDVINLGGTTIVFDDDNFKDLKG